MSTFHPAASSGSLTWLDPTRKEGSGPMPNMPTPHR